MQLLLYVLLLCTVLVSDTVERAQSRSTRAEARGHRTVWHGAGAIMQLGSYVCSFFDKLSLLRASLCCERMNFRASFEF
jgi:hypothetical protein